MYLHVAVAFYRNAWLKKWQNSPQNKISKERGMSGMEIGRPSVRAFPQFLERASGQNEKPLVPRRGLQF
ncbi:MAG: hypothetical protein ACLPIX_21210 [Rhodomicrobium sp.]